MNASTNESDDAMQRAFQEYMVTGGKKATAAASVAACSSSPATRPLLPSAPQQEQERKKRQQRRRSIYKSHESALQDFHHVLVRDWLHVDDQLGRVVDSIVNLRHRIRITNARLVKRREEVESSYGSIKFSKTMSSSWKSYGYRGGGGASWTCQKREEQEHQDQESDLELALSHSLLMHENMMATLRKPLLPLLHEAQETLGRRLQDFMAVVLDACADIMLTTAAADDDDDNGHMEEDNDDDDFEWMSRMQANLQICQELYRALAEEVYRKQELIQGSILDTVHDGLLGLQNNDNNNNNNSDGRNESYDDMMNKSPLQASSADGCSSQWSRQGKASALYKFQDVLDRIQQQQQQRQQRC